MQNNKQDGGLVSVGLSVRRRVEGEDGGLRGCRLETGTVLLAVVSLSVSRSLVQMLMCRSHC